MIKLSDVIEPLLDREIDNVIYGAASDIDTVAHVLEIDPHYLSVQVRIHLPFYPRADLLNGNGIEVIRDILMRLRHSLDDFSAVHKEHRILNGIDSLPSGATVKDSGGELFLIDSQRVRSTSLRLDSADGKIGLAIQERMHYIHSSREDTQFHLGLFANNFEAPIAYAAFSKLDRDYLLDALVQSQAVPELSPASVAVMTRAFGYSPLPKNAMSKLFDYSAKQMSQAGFKYLVTALNPFLGFKGSIFSGSSFIPFASSPMRYWYNEDGSYMNRRSTGSASPQKFDTPPIIWLVRGLESARQRRLEAFAGPVYQISLENYDAR